MNKRKISLIILLFFILCGLFYFIYKNIHSATTSNGEITKIITFNNISYDIYNFELFSGELIGKKNGIAKYKNIINNGKITKVINYYPNGNIKAELIIENGDIISYVSRYENGNLHFIANLKNGEIEGESYIFYENGNKRLQGFFKEGNPVGNFFIFAKNGILRYEIDFEKEKIIQFDEYGKIANIIDKNQIEQIITKEIKIWTE